MPMIKSGMLAFQAAGLGLWRQLLYVTKARILVFVRISEILAYAFVPNENVNKTKRNNTTKATQLFTSTCKEKYTFMGYTTYLS